MRLAVIIPAYNEGPTIASVIAEVALHQPKALIVVVNNASTDDTAQKTLDAFRRLKVNGLLLREPARGKGMAIRRAFAEVEADAYVMMDADMTYPASAIKDLVEPISTGIADMVVGDRLSGGDYARQNKRAFHGFGNRLVIYLIRILFGSKLEDIMSGFRAFSRVFIKGFPILSRGFELETEMTLHALDKRFGILEIPIQYLDRPEGSLSKLNTYSDGLRVLRTIFNILRDYKPLSFFSIAAGFFLLSGLGSGSVVLYEFAMTQHIYHVPTAILATGLCILALLSFCIGVVLDRVARSDRFFYELSLLQLRDRGSAARPLSRRPK